MVELQSDSLLQEIEANKVVFVQYSATWCGNCKIMKPKFNRLSQEISEAKFILVDAEKFPESRKLAQVDNLPTFAAFVNGQLVGQVQTNKGEVLNQFVHEITAHQTAG